MQAVVHVYYTCIVYYTCVQLPVNYTEYFSIAYQHYCNNKYSSDRCDVTRVLILRAVGSHVKRYYKYISIAIYYKYEY